MRNDSYVYAQLSSVAILGGCPPSQIKNNLHKSMHDLNPGHSGKPGRVTQVNQVRSLKAWNTEQWLLFFNDYYF